MVVRRLFAARLYNALRMRSGRCEAATQSCRKTTHNADARIGHFPCARPFSDVTLPLGWARL